MVTTDRVLSSKIGRRIFLFFVLSALTPILFLAAIYFTSVTDLLRSQAYAQLDSMAKNYRTTLYERLLLADESLRTSITGFENAKTRGVELRTQIFGLSSALPPEKRIFSSLNLELPSGKLMPVIGQAVAVYPLGQEALAHLERGEPLLLFRMDPEAATRILVVRALDPKVPEQGVIIAGVNPSFLWGEWQDMPYNTVFCVLNAEDHQPLYCPEPQKPGLIMEAIDASKVSSPSRFDWRAGENSYLASSGEIFLRAKFFESGWLVVASQGENIALGPVKTFDDFLVGTFVLSLLVALLLSVTQIRRILAPLTILTGAARNIGAGNLSTRIAEITNDEFGDVSRSFNIMSTALDEQFSRKRALSSIDQAILAEEDVCEIMARALEYLYVTFSAHYICVIDLEVGATDIVNVHWFDGNGRKPVIKGTMLEKTMGSILIANPDGFWVDNDFREQAVRVRRLDIGGAHEFSMPIIWKGALMGMLTLGYSIRPSLMRPQIDQLREFAERIGVALAANAREKMLYRQARFDQITGLPNRFLFVDRLQQEIAQAKRSERVLVILFIDLDRFKLVNDTLGHAAGDQLLMQAGVRLRNCVRDGDTVARFGGDEFAILLSSPTLPQGAAIAADHVIAALEKPFRLMETDNFLTASIGIATYPTDGLTPDDLLRGADIAMYRAKGRGGSSYVFFEEVMNETIAKHANIEREMRGAIIANSFKAHYQPLINARSGRVHGVEALVRWEHPQQGMIPPGDFIHIAEENGLIEQIGHIVLMQGCAQFRLWLDEGIDIQQICVNLSPRQLRQENIVEIIESELQKNMLPGSCLELEITESIFVDKNEALLKTLERIRGLGVRLAIDDFGTGYSSLAYLDRLPFDTLKIDRQFVDKIDGEGNGVIMAKTILMMAKTMRKIVVAEGVETQAQVTCLRDIDCDLLQGYYFSRPLSVTGMSEFLRKQGAWPSQLSAA